MSANAMMLRLSKLPASFPLTISATFIGARYFLGDSVTQYYEGSPAKKSWDWQRSLVFTVFGVYTGYVYGWALFRTYPFFDETAELSSLHQWSNCRGVLLLSGPLLSRVLRFAGYARNWAIFIVLSVETIQTEYLWGYVELVQVLAITNGFLFCIPSKSHDTDIYSYRGFCLGSNSQHYQGRASWGEDNQVRSGWRNRKTPLLI